MFWLGDAAPAWASQAAALFKAEYPGWDVEFLRWRIKDLERVRKGGASGDLEEALSRAMAGAFDGAGPYGAYVANQKRIYGSRLRPVMLLSDVLRMELLNSFGGVYVDADSVPGRPFDEALLSSGRFCVSLDLGGKRVPDNYFMGRAEGAGPWGNPMDPASAVQVLDPAPRGADFQYRRSAFAAGRARKASSGFYVEHYAVRSWEAFGGMQVDDFRP